MGLIPNGKTSIKRTSRTNERLLYFSTNKIVKHREGDQWNNATIEPLQTPVDGTHQVTCSRIYYNKSLYSHRSDKEVTVCLRYTNNPRF